MLRIQLQIDHRLRIDLRISFLFFPSYSPVSAPGCLLLQLSKACHPGEYEHEFCNTNKQHNLAVYLFTQTGTPYVGKSPIFNQAYKYKHFDKTCCNIQNYIQSLDMIYNETKTTT